MKKHIFQLVRFGVVGTGNMGLDFLIYLGLTRSSEFFETYYPLAAAISFLIAGLNSYIWNKHWTFKDKVAFSHTQLLQFYAASAIGLALNIGLLALFVEIVHMNDLIAKILSSVLVGLWNFSLQKFWIFRQKLG